MTDTRTANELKRDYIELEKSHRALKLASESMAQSCSGLRTSLAKVNVRTVEYQIDLAKCRRKRNAALRQLDSLMATLDASSELYGRLSDVRGELMGGNQ